jgi:endoglucanase
MKSPRHLVVCLLAALALAASPGVRAQNLALPVYQGFQPDLVASAEDGLATGQPRLRHVYVAAPDVLALVVDERAMAVQAIRPYVAESGDQRVGRGVMKLGPDGAVEWPRFVRVVRDGMDIGELAGPPGREYLYPPLEIVGERLNREWADQPDGYAVSGERGRPVTPVAVWRKTTPEMREWVRGGGQASTARHQIFLRLPAPLRAGQSYRIELRGEGRWREEPIVFRFDDRRLRTEAIQVNQLGYHPRQTEKAAFLSLWLGEGGDAALGGFRNFELVDDATGRTVHRGEVRLRQAATPGKTRPLYLTRDPSPEQAPMTLRVLDFSGFTTPGRYRVVVPGLGSSFPFRIDERVWEDAGKISMQAFFNHRSGIELGPPHTSFIRPRDMHPDDGFVVHRTDPAVYYDTKRFPQTTRVGNAFNRIQASILLDTKVPQAWGGWHDAADFDRSLMPQNHAMAVHVMLDLYESNPDYFRALSLNIPESGNAIPDILDEALWCMDLFLRLQEPDGAVPSAIESIEHPGAAPSWLETLPTAITPSMPQTCHAFAAAAAQLSLALERYDAPLAARYREAALRAMDWADNNAHVPNIHSRPDILPERVHANLAFAWLYRLTGEERWHERFKTSLRELYPNRDAFMNEVYRGPSGVAAYAHLPEGRGDALLRAWCREVVLARAEREAGRILSWAWGLHPRPPHWGERSELPWDVVLAHRLTGEARFVDALVATSQPAMGRNPNNASYTWGLGSRHVVTFQLDPNRTNTPYPDGTTIYGPFPRDIWGAPGVERQLEDTIHPKWEQWPHVESVFNIRHAPLTEYAIGSLATPLLARGYLAAVYAPSVEGGELTGAAAKSGSRAKR